MRITQTLLIDLARREIEKRAEANGLLAAYLIGSVVHDQAVFGGAADIDLVLIHDGEALLGREIVGLSDDVHLDILHHDRQLYAQPRELRRDPWIGPAIYDPLPLYDPDHFFEWAQASIRGQFLRADFRVARAQTFLERARRLQSEIDPAADWIGRLVVSAFLGANAIATLAGPPASGRRALSALRQACQQAEFDQAYAGLLRLLGADRGGLHKASDWVGGWARAFDAAAPFSTRPELFPERRAYYLKAFQSQLESGEAEAILPALLETWARALSVLRGFSQEGDHLASFEAAAADLALDPDSAAERLADLDAYLDHLEAFLEDWSVRHGA